MLTLTEAAKETGLTRSAVFKAIKSGRLSATKDAQGRFLIDPVELSRVYEVNINKVDKSKQIETGKESQETAFLRRENELLRQQIERDREQIERDREQISDLKSDRDQWRNQAMMLLAYQPEKQPDITQPDRKEDSLLWRKLFGRR
jgi:hypothetical protein